MSLFLNSFSIFHLEITFFIKPHCLETMHTIKIKLEIRKSPLNQGLGW